MRSDYILIILERRDFTNFVYYIICNMLKKEALRNSLKIYKTMGSTGAANLAIGICILVGGIVSGILLIVNGARLLKHKGKIMF